MQGEGKSSKKNMKLSMPCIAVLFVLTAIAFTSLAVIPVAAQVTVTVNAQEYVDVEDETFVVTIDVDSVTDFSVGNFDLCFDSSVVKVSEVKEGEINGEEIPIYMWRFIDADTVRVAFMLEPVGEKCVSGSGYLAEIEFDVKGEEGEESKIDISNGKLGNVSAKKIPANWINATIIIGVEPTPTPEEDGDEEEEEEEVGEEVIPGSPNITVWEPAEAVVSNAVGEPRTFNVTVNQIADISWQINGTEVQTNESTREAAFTNASADIGTWNVSAIATNATTGLFDMHTWIWNVTLTATVTPTPTLAPGETPAPEAETGIEETSKPQGKKTTPKEKPTPVPAAPPTPKPKPPGFEAILAIGGMLTIAYILLRRR
jgi:hypothetical protein